MAALPAGLAGAGCLLTILREIAGIVPRAATAMTVLAALSPGFRCPFRIVGEIA